jgi:hypothetical protein
MEMVPINYVAVVGAAVAAFVLGSLWFGPLFGKAWMKTMGMTMEDAKARMQSDPSAKGKMMRGYGIMAVTTLIMSFVLAHSIAFASAYLNDFSVWAGVLAGFWSWLGFVVPVSLGGVLWENKSWKWWFITAGYYLVSLVMMGKILALWLVA